MWFKNSVALTSAHTDINKDSLSVEITCIRQRKNIVVPLLIFRRDKKKFNITYVINGKNISGRAYTCRFKMLEITDKHEVVARSKDSALFTEAYVPKTLLNAVSPMYETKHIMYLNKPETMDLQMHLEIELINKYSVTESFWIDMPLKKISEKGFSLFNPF